MNLRIVEKDDAPLFVGWFSNPEFSGEYNPIAQYSKAELVKRFEDFDTEKKWFVIEKKDGSKIGSIGFFPGLGNSVEIGFAVIPSERCKGYCSEAAKMIVDYLFLSKNIGRLQAQTETRNKASQRILQNIGFKKEGQIRKSYFVRGLLRDTFLFSILREEWKEPRALTSISQN